MDAFLNTENPLIRDEYIGHSTFWRIRLWLLLIWTANTLRNKIDNKKNGGANTYFF